MCCIVPNNLYLCVVKVNKVDLKESKKIQTDATFKTLKHNL